MQSRLPFPLQEELVLQVQLNEAHLDLSRVWSLWKDSERAVEGKARETHRMSLFQSLGATTGSATCRCVPDDQFLCAIGSDLLSAEQVFLKNIVFNLIRLFCGYRFYADEIEWLGDLVG